MTSDNALIETARPFVREAMRLVGTPGLNLAVARRGEVVWEEGFGYADLAHQRPMTAGTIVRGGSISKLYTAVAALQLIEQGRLGLHEPVNRYLTDFRVINPLGERDITVYDLLTHRSGLTSDSASSHFAVPLPLGEHLKEQYASGRSDSNLGEEPRWSGKVGAEHRYSNLGTATLGYLVEIANAEGRSFSDYIAAKILQPLGMASTAFPPAQTPPYISSEFEARISTGYMHIGPALVPTPPVFFGNFPCGGILTTPGDHARFLLALMNGGHPLLGPEWTKRMLTPQLYVESRGLWIGLMAWISEPGERTGYFGHNGQHMYGWSTVSRAYPALDLVVVVAKNIWEIPKRGEAGREDAGELIADFIAATVAGEQARSTATLDWKLSYLLGLIAVDQLKYRIAIPEPLTDAMIDTMCAGVTLAEGPVQKRFAFEREAFLLAARSLRDAIQSPGFTSTRDFVASSQPHISLAELELLFRCLGARTNVAF